MNRCLCCHVYFDIKHDVSSIGCAHIISKGNKTFHCKTLALTFQWLNLEFHGRLIHFFARKIDEIDQLWIIMTYYEVMVDTLQHLLIYDL